jgi:hypothetical protein
MINLLSNLPRNVEVHVVTLRRKISGTTIHKSTEGILDHFRRPIAVHYLSAAQDTVLYNMDFQLACLRHLLGLHEQYDFDIVHSNHCHMPDLYDRLFRRNHIPTITTVHDFLDVKRSSIRRSGAQFLSLDRSERVILALYPFLRLCEVLYIRKIPAFIAPSRSNFLPGYVMTPMNPLGYQMAASKQAVEAGVTDLYGRTKIIAINILASGAVSLDNAIEYLRGFKDKVFVLTSASTKPDRIRRNFRKLRASFS